MVQSADSFVLNEIIVDVSRDSLTAVVNIITDGSYVLTETELIEFLLAYEISTDLIKRDVVEDIVTNKRYNEEVVVAEGIPVIDGTSGYFEYFFSQNEDKAKPLILADGSVDYSSVNYVGTVSNGDRIACYHPPVPGVPGLTVYGQEIKPREGRDYPVPALRGCRYDEETKSFFAEVDGRVNATPARIEVIEELTINKNINVAYGNVDFIGNIIINGDVEEGVTIRASSDITITGLVQSSNIFAGGNITVGGGILGGGDCEIECGGNLKARFIEHAYVTAHGNIDSNYIMSSNIHSGNTITAREGVGIISGGVIYAAAKVDANRIGNKSKVNTKVTVGVIGDEEVKVEKATKLLEFADKQIPILNIKEAQLLSIKEKSNDDQYRIKVVKKELLIEYIKQAMAVATLFNIGKVLESNKQPCYIMADTLYAGTFAFVDGKQYPVTFDMSNVVLKSGEPDHEPEEEYFR